MDNYREYINKMKISFILKVKFLVSILIFGLIVGVAFANTSPFDREGFYSLQGKTITGITPLTRIEKINRDNIELVKMTDDLVYFSTKFPEKYDTAKVKITFQNPNAEQRLDLGFKDKTEWHYNTQIIDSPFFYSPDWKKIGSGPVLYQRSYDFYTVEDFLKNFRKNSIIGTIDYELPSRLDASIENYTPQKENIVIDTPLRGMHTMYAYLDGEPFYMKVVKQDLNWYEDPDVLEVRIYKDSDLVYTATLDDDGDVTDSKNLGSPLEVVIRNPGPELPEAGVYKIVFDTNTDTVIKRIETNLHKIVFSSPVFPVENTEVYPNISSQTSSTTLYTENQKFTVSTYHGSALQNILVNGKNFNLNFVNTPILIVATSTSDIKEIQIPRSDVIINGLGFYAFSKDSYFTPTTYNIVPITGNSNAEFVDYVISKYAPNKVENGYFVAEREFDLSTAVPQKDTLSWIIKAPGLKEDGNEVIIKDIEVEYYKKGWW